MTEREAPGNSAPGDAGDNRSTTSNIVEQHNLIEEQCEPDNEEEFHEIFNNWVDDFKQKIFANPCLKTSVKAMISTYYKKLKSTAALESAMYSFGKYNVISKRLSKKIPVSVAAKCRRKSRGIGFRKNAPRGCTPKDMRPSEHNFCQNSNYSSALLPPRRNVAQQNIHSLSQRVALGYR